MNDKQIYALVDCNNFYVSCERAFNPAIANKPVVVLSNNDGNIISRSAEAKALGIPMGAPFFKWQHYIKKYQVKVFSSNYELYGEMSNRVMRLLESYAEQIEIYSIDEAFLLLNDKAIIDAKKYIYKCTGIPISIGLGSTKTLAKAANYLAKKSENIKALYENHTVELQNIPVENVWGVGSQFASRLKKLNVHTAADLSLLDPNYARLHFNVTVEKIIYELRGVVCFPLRYAKQREQIIFSRSFGKPLTRLVDLEDAIQDYSKKAVIRLNKEQCRTHTMLVFIATNQFSKEDKQYRRCVGFPFPQPTNQVEDIVRVAKKCIKHLFKSGFNYHRAGLVLTDLIPIDIEQLDMFGYPKIKQQSILQTSENAWQMKARYRSSRYTTRWDELLNVDTRK